MCEAIGLPELPRDERFATNSARVAHVDELGERLEGVFRTRPAADWVELLRSVSVPIGPINTVAEAYELAASLGLEPTEEVDGMPLPRPAVRFDGVRPPIRARPPRLDEHGAEVRAWLESEEQ
jgi:crotonobetainyl-CoA:carnitine CoA-transferase CaiB-like acyl-CoA transferase